MVNLSDWKKRTHAYFRSVKHRSANLARLRAATRAEHVHAAPPVAEKQPSVSAQKAANFVSSQEAKPAGPPPMIDPLIVNGCPIWPYTRCPGADLRHADLSARDLAGADLRGAFPVSYTPPTPPPICRF